MKIRLAIFLALSLFALNISAQDSLKIKKRDLFIGVGMTSYKGDLGSGYSSPALMGVVGIKLNNQKRLNGNLNFSFGSVSGQQLDYKYEGDSEATPNSYFNTSLIAFNYDLQFNIFDREKFKLYFSQGIGFARFNVKDEFGNSLKDQSNTRAFGEDYGNITVFLPTLLGFKYILPNDFGIGIQGGFYNLMTDYIDNISQWGNKSGNDNLLSVRFQLSIPINL